MRAFPLMKDIELAERMRGWRKLYGFTLQQVADLAGCSKQCISNIELGEAGITVARLDNICTKAFKTTLREFFGPLPKRAAA